MTENDQMKIADARMSDIGKILTASQFDECLAITCVIAREIRKTGTFRDKLGDYAFAFARSEKFDAMKGETIIRDIFKSRYGKSMNEMRQELMEREAALQDKAQDQAIYHARSIEAMIADGETMPFYRAYDHAAHAMAEQHSITESGAKSLMKEAYRAVAGQELYDKGKELEKQFHEPKRDAARQAQEVEKARKPARAPARQR